jgi:hypothetical protein
MVTFFALVRLRCLPNLVSWVQPFPRKKALLLAGFMETYQSVLCTVGLEWSVFTRLHNLAVAFFAALRQQLLWCWSSPAPLCFQNSGCFALLHGAVNYS